MGGGGGVRRQNLKSETAENAWKLSILPSPRYFVSFEIFYDPIRRTFLAPGGGGGVGVHPIPRTPLPTGLKRNVPSQPWHPNELFYTFCSYRPSNLFSD